MNQPLYKTYFRAFCPTKISQAAKAAWAALLCCWVLPASLSLCLIGLDASARETVDASSRYLSLEAAQRRALADNPTLHAVEARVRQAAERVKQARAAFLPTLDVEWSASHTQLPDRSVREARQGIQGQLLSNISRLATYPIISPLTTASTAASAIVQAGQAYDAVPDSMDAYAVRLTLGYALFTGFARKHAHAMARFGARESAAAADEARRLILEAVAQTYHGAQLAGERVAIAGADRDFNLRLLEDACAKQRLGAASLSEVLNFEVRLRASEAQLINVRQDQQLACIALAALMGMEDALPEADLELDDIELAADDAMSVPTFETLYERAAMLRPDLAASRLAIQRTAANVGLQQASYYPAVTAFVSRDASRTEDSRFDGEDFSTTVGVALSYNLFAGGRHRAAVAAARQSQKEAERLHHAAEITVAEELRAVLARLTAAQQQLTLQSENASYVEQNRNMVEKEFQVGQASLALLNQAQRDLVEAQAMLALAHVSLRAAWHALHTATAETLTRFEEAPDVP